jgi:Rieske Fe-S protein
MDDPLTPRANAGDAPDARTPHTPPPPRRAGARLDVYIDAPGREGLAGTTPGNLFAPLIDDDTGSIPPDGRPLAEQPKWRRDFPIDWPEDHYVARRDFVKFTTLTSLAFATGQVWIGVQNWLRRRRGLPPQARIVELAKLAPGTSFAFRYPDAHDDAVLCRMQDGAIVAFGQRCTHLSCAVVPRPEQSTFFCPCHQGSFDMASGRPLAGPPRRPLDRIKVEVRGGEVWAVGIERRTV